MQWLLKLCENDPWRAWRLKGNAGIWQRKEWGGMEQEWNKKELQNLTWTELPSSVSQLAVNCRLTERSTLVNRHLTEFNSVPFTETCFVTGNRRSAIGQPTSSTSVDRQPTEGSSVPFLEWWFSVRKSDGQPSVSWPLTNTHLFG